MSVAFTIAQIAQTLGITKQAVSKRLVSIKPSGMVAIRGKIASSWTIDQLPDDMRAAIQSCVSSKGYRDAEHLLTAPPERWYPKINGETVNLVELHPDCLENAVKLQRALLPLLPRLEVAASYAEMEKEGLALYAREFGHAITSR